MHISNADLFKHVLDLNEKDRAALAGLLISSLEEEPDSDLESIWRLEVERRVSELDASEVDTIPWEDAKKRLMNPAGYSYRSFQTKTGILERSITSYPSKTRIKNWYFT